MHCPVGRPGSSTLWLAPPSQSRCPRGLGQVLVQGLSRGAPGPWLPIFPGCAGANVPRPGVSVGEFPAWASPGEVLPRSPRSPASPPAPQPQASTDGWSKGPGGRETRGRHQRPLQPADRVGSLHCLLGRGWGHLAGRGARVLRSVWYGQSAGGPKGTLWRLAGGRHRPEGGRSGGGGAGALRPGHTGQLEPQPRCRATDREVAGLRPLLRGFSLGMDGGGEGTRSQALRRTPGTWTLEDLVSDERVGGGVQGREDHGLPGPPPPC